MPPFKNITIHQITIYLAAFLGFLNTLVFCIIYFSDAAIEESVMFWILLLAVSVLCSYFIIKFFLDKFVFRRIKLIYKLITDSKKSLAIKDLTEDFESMTVDSVQEDVVEWAERKEKEIEYLTGLEEYRRNFLGNISHELKTPIFSIQGYVLTLLDGGLYDEKINKKYLENAASNLERLQNIVEDLEIINKLESGKMVLDTEIVDISHLAVEVIEDLKFTSQNASVSISLKDGASRGYNVNANRESIRQVLNNLINNAIKYGKKGGYVKVSFYDMGDQVLIEVSDNGIGIEEKHLKHLFDRFYRADPSRSRKQGGSGLGLSIVKHILEAHNQTINVRSTIGAGSTFGFTLRKA